MVQVFAAVSNLSRAAGSARIHSIDFAAADWVGFTFGDLKPTAHLASLWLGCPEVYQIWGGFLSVTGRSGEQVNRARHRYSPGVRNDARDRPAREDLAGEAQ